MEITPGQRAATAGADVVLFAGDIGYQPQLEQAVDSAGGQIVSLTDVAGPERLLEQAATGLVDLIRHQARQFARALGW